MTRRGDVEGFAHCGGFTRRLPPNVKLVMLNSVKLLSRNVE